VRSTVMLRKLHSAWVTSRLRPEISSITSGVKLIHQEGGSTLFTSGAFESALWVWAGSAARIAEPQNAAKTESNTKTKLWWRGLNRGENTERGTGKA